MTVEPMPQYTVALLAAAALAVFIIVIAWPRRAAPGAKPLIAFMVCILLWTLPYAVHWLIADANARFFWLDATYLGVVFAAVAFLAFALDYTGRERWLTQRTLIALSGVPVITLAALFTDSAHGLFYGGQRTSGLIFSGGPVFWLNVIYGYGLMLLALVLLIRDFRHAPRLQRQQAGIILIGTLTPFITNLVSLAGFSPLKDLDLTPFAFAVTGLFYAMGLFQFGLLDLVPIARSVLTEQLSDGVLVIDQQQRIVDLNPAAQSLLTRTEAQLIGRTWAQVLADWQIAPAQSANPIELTLSAGRITEARLSPLTDRRGQQRGAVILLRDITAHNRAAQLLERRASQLAIINEIGRQITAALAVGDVLDQAAQLMHERLGVQHVGIFVLDDARAELVLRSLAGDFAHLFTADHRLKIGQGIVGWVAEHGQRLLANDVRIEPRYVNVLGEVLPTRSELAVPIIIAGEVRGVLDVQSPHIQAFEQNDVLAQETLADQIAVALENARLHEAAQREIVERTRAEEALRESEAMLNATGQMAKVGGWELDAATRTVKWTAETYRIHGLPVGQVPDLVEAIQFYHHADRPQLEQAIQRALERGESFDLELRFVSATGQARWVQSVGHAQWQAGRVVKLFGTFQDITERKGIEDALLLLNTQLEQRVSERTAELQAANLRLTELDHLKDEFLSRTSHELRTPLTTILISLELLEMSQPDKRERYMQRLKQSAVRLREMIEDVLLFSQLNLNVDSAAFGATDLNNLIEGRLTTWQQLSIEHGLQIQLDLTHDLPPARVSGELVMQAVTRLVTNAMNYTPTGTVTVSTALRTEADQRWVTLSVADTGPGIADDELPHIFERFYRGRAAADYKTLGTGVGLSISREIAEKLGGRLTVTTRVGAGSTFTLWLPAA